jgi:hypothetical protein
MNNTFYIQKELHLFFKIFSAIGLKKNIICNQNDIN